jgi:hypothetical protein
MVARWVHHISDWSLHSWSLLAMGQETMKILFHVHYHPSCMVHCSLCSVFAVMHLEDQMRDVRWVGVETAGANNVMESCYVCQKTILWSQLINGKVLQYSLPLSKQLLSELGFYLKYLCSLQHFWSHEVNFSPMLLTSDLAIPAAFSFWVWNFGSFL